jgi:predicted outer membrane lipoprotein
MKYSKHILHTALACAFAAMPALQADAQNAAAKPAATKPAAAKPVAAQRTFASADEAAAALIEAVRAKDVNALLAVVGPPSETWLFSGDKVADTNDWQRFLAAYDQKHAFEEKDGKSILTVGNDAWPFPAPIVKRGAKWAFDANAGRDEIVNRRIGRNELDAIQTLLAVVDAQREYAAKDADGNGFADYARRFRSTPGKKDGLYWPDEAGAAQSPLGPLVAVASREGYGKQVKDDKPSPYHGYFYKIVTSQGKEAPGGAYDYMVGDKLLGGFAVVAWPSSYRASGVTTFIVNHDGVVYEKDLGPQTASIAAAMTRYNPDATWRKAE